MAADPGPRPGGAAALAERLAGALAAVAIAGLLGVALLITVDVCLRYFFASPIRGFFDVQPLAFAVLLAGCMPLALARGSHIAVTLVGDRLGGGRILDRFGRLMTLLFFALMGWQYLRYAAEMMATGQTMAVLRWPVWPWWGAVALLVLAGAVVGLLTLGNRRQRAD
jgi:TRAP-type C4-dicarboxylate transport system permease small subunit